MSSKKIRAKVHKEHIFHCMSGFCHSHVAYLSFALPTVLPFHFRCIVLYAQYFFIATFYGLLFPFKS